MEQEIKLLIDPARAPAVLRSRALASVRQGPVRTERLVSIYYDTPDRRLKERRVALRLRREGRRWIQTLKGEGETVGGLSSRPELEWPLTGPEPDYSLVRSSSLGKLFKRKLCRELAPAFETDMRRSAVELLLPGGSWAELSIDVGEIRAGRRREPICEVEIELTAGAPRALFDFAFALLREVPFEVGRLSKAERGYALMAGAASPPSKAHVVAIDGDAPAAAALGKLVRACADHARANEAGFLKRTDPEYLHQLRVGLRRLRAVLAVPREASWREALAPLQAELKWLWEILGEARNWDVLEHEVLAGLAGQHGREIEPLRRRAARLRREALVRAREAVRSTRYQAMWLSLGVLMSSSVALIGGEHSARQLADAVLDRRWRKVRRWGEPLPQAPASLHRLRIETKKLRYLAQLLSGVYDGKEPKAFLKALSELQDVLGALNDGEFSLTLLQRAAEGGRPPLEREVVSLAAGWVAAKQDEARQDLPRAWQAFADQAPFWSEG